MLKDNYSEWVRDAIYDKLDKENNSDFLKSLINNKESELQILKKRLKDNGHKTSEFQKILQDNYVIFFHQDRIDLSDIINRNWIESRIIPALKKKGCTPLNPNKILEIFKENANQNNKELVM